MLTTDVNIQKRIERARERLRELDLDFDTPNASQLRARLDAVLAVIYLLFSQGCHATRGDMPIRRDLCDEARRLARMLVDQSVGDVPAVHALLALMCFHAARFDARVARDGAIVLLEEQDRSAWNWSDVREGMAWLAKSAAGDELTRYHVEAGIAWEHCRASTFADTDWRRIAELYDTLDRIAPSPINALNRASPKPTCTARKPGSTAWPPCVPKTSPPAIPAGTRSSASSTSASVSTPPPSAPGRRLCAGRAAPIKSSCAAGLRIAGAMEARTARSNADPKKKTQTNVASEGVVQQQRQMGIRHRNGRWENLVPFARFPRNTQLISAC